MYQVNSVINFHIFNYVIVNCLNGNTRFINVYGILALSVCAPGVPG